MFNQQNESSPEQMGDAELLRAYCSFEDHEHLTPDQKALVAEMDRRELEL